MSTWKGRWGGWSDPASHRLADGWLSRRELVLALQALPPGLYIGAHRYDTDDRHVLHLWNDKGESFDVDVPKEDA